MNYLKSILVVILFVAVAEEILDENNENIGIIIYV